MSTYAVFGMTRHRALESARKTIKPSRNGKPLPQSEWLALVDKEADKIMAGTRCIQLSEKFDSPAFARDFLEIASRYESRNLHIKAYAKTGEIHPKTGREVRAWVSPD